MMNPHPFDVSAPEAADSARGHLVANWNDRRLTALLCGALLAALFVLGLADVARAQQSAPSADLKRVVGRVEVLRKGHSQWVPAVVGDRLVEGDDIRAFAGAQAELALPDTSTAVLAENSRLLLSKLEFDPQTQSRYFLLHLAVGKVRATVAQAALTLARVRQSNFAISTPTAVAAARGTIMWVYTDGASTTTAVEPETGFNEGHSPGARRL
jgi:hypothetical protein